MEKAFKNKEGVKHLELSVQDRIILALGLLCAMDEFSILAEEQLLTVECAKMLKRILDGVPVPVDTLATYYEDTTGIAIDPEAFEDFKFIFDNLGQFLSQEELINGSITM